MTQAHAAVPFEESARPDRGRPVWRDDPWQATASSAVSPAAVPSGWYPEPAMLRFWDGEHWTDRTCVAAPPDPRGRLVAVAARPEVHAPVVPLPTRSAQVGEAPAPRVGGWRELRRFLTVALLALASGAAVAALGITLTV